MTCTIKHLSVLSEALFGGLAAFSYLCAAFDTSV